MKKLFLSAIALIFAATLVAQEGTVNMGFTLGFTEPVEYYRTAISSTKKDGKNITNGFKVGYLCETNLIKGFGVSMGLNYSFTTDVGAFQPENKGMAFPQKRIDHYYHFIEVPVDWQYKFLIAKKTYVGLYSGPTIQVGLSNVFTTYRKSDPNTIKKIGIDDVYKRDEDKDDKLDYNRVNVTWGVGAFFQYKQYFIRGGYDFGIMPIYRDTYYDTSSKTGWNREGRLDQWQIKLGIYFWQFE